MFRTLRLALAILFATAFVLGAWSSLAPVTANCLGCETQMHSGQMHSGQMSDMGHPGGKDTPQSDDCMTKLSCSMFCAQLPERGQEAAVSIVALVPFPAATAAAFQSNAVSPNLSPPRSIA